MKDDLKKTENFIERWSRLKHEAATATPAPPAPRLPAGAPPELPPLDRLSFESDFKAFLHPKVEERLKREALKKLFGDPHFNQMDGLDVYIDDYTIPDPLPEGMLENLSQYQTLFGKPEEPKPREKVAAVPEDAADHPDAALPQAGESPALPLPLDGSEEGQRCDLLSQAPKEGAPEPPLASRLTDNS